MNIGYEAKRVYQNRTGLGNAARSIVHSMDANYPNHQYHLFAPRITNLFSIDGNANMHAHAPNFWLGNQIKAWWRSKGVVKQLTQNEIVEPAHPSILPLFTKPTIVDWFTVEVELLLPTQDITMICISLITEPI